MKTYPSKVGLELAIPLAGLFVGLGSLMAYKGLWVGVGIILVVSLLILHLFMTTHYKLGKNTLNIQSGFFFHKQVPVASIKKIIETRSPLSSPALSLDRLEVVYNRFDSVLISPTDKMTFIAELLHQKPDIEIQLKRTRAEGRA